MDWFIVCCNWMESSNKQVKYEIEIIWSGSIYDYLLAFCLICGKLPFYRVFLYFRLVLIVGSIFNVDFIILQSNVFMIEFSKLAKSAISKQQQQRYQNKLKWLYARSKSNEEEKRDAKKRKRLEENERIEWKLNAVQMESI